jgi:hypothetical protein
VLPEGFFCASFLTPARNTVSTPIVNHRKLQVWSVYWDFVRDRLRSLRTILISPEKSPLKTGFVADSFGARSQIIREKAVFGNSSERIPEGGWEKYLHKA